MTNSLRIISQFILLVLVQVLILNQISIFGYAVPFLYIYLIIKLPLNMNRSLVLLIAFLLGLCIDAFTNSYGINASATVLAAFARPYIQKLFFNQEDFTDSVPSARSLGSAKFYKYSVLVVLLHHTAIFLIEYLSLTEAFSLALHALLSTILTLIIIIALESFSYNRRLKNERR
ncbi:MAG: rod shape-determining protein MreD [Dysgonamonadaceae bacterium]